MAAWTARGVEPACADHDSSHPPVTLRLDLDYHLATDGTQRVLVVRTLHFDNPHDYYLGDSFYEITGGAGWVSGSRAAYSIAARIGTGGVGYLHEFLFGDCRITGGVCHPQLMGISTGIAFDGAVGRVPGAWTIPIDAYVDMRTSERTSLGPIVGASWAFAGADRALGWRAGLDLIVAGVGRGDTVLEPRNLHLSVVAERLAGATFLGLTIGIEGLNRYDHFLQRAP